MANTLPRFLEKIYELLVNKYNLTVTAQVSPPPNFGSDAPKFLVPLCKRMNWFGFNVT